MSWAEIGETQWDKATLWDKATFDRHEGTGQKDRINGLLAENNELAKKVQFLEWENKMLKGNTGLKEVCETLLKTIEGNTARIRELSEQNMRLVEILDDRNRPDLSVDF